MHRFLITAGDITGRSILLDQDESHHAVRVLRLTAGAEIEVIDGHGRTYACRITHAERRAVRAEVLEVREQQRPLPVHLAPAWLKGQAMEVIIRKATELGAATITPLLTGRTIVRVTPEAFEKRVNDWKIIAGEACKQCGNAWLPQIEKPQSLDEFVRHPPGGPLFAAMFRKEARLPGEAIATLPSIDGAPVFLTGPEGDWTPVEEDRLLAAGALPVTLGPLVLRADTAVIAGLAILQHELARRTGTAHRGVHS